LGAGGRGVVGGVIRTGTFVRVECDVPFAFGVKEAVGGGEHLKDPPTISSRRAAVAHGGYYTLTTEVQVVRVWLSRNSALHGRPDDDTDDDDRTGSANLGNIPKRTTFDLRLYSHEPIGLPASV